MSTQIENNKRIAKNTLFMYFRMLLTMVVSLYTSRVVLKTLGVEDFGIYNIVGGVVVFFTFINHAMSNGTQRYLSYELGKQDGNVSKIFSACLYIHLGISIIIFILAETIGLWFLNTQMNFPENRIYAVNWVYQFSIFGCMVNIIRIPYQANIIAHERMSFYAYTGLIEVILKLLIVYLLVYLTFDKLITYSILIFCVIFFITLWFIVYCRSKFINIKLIKIYDKQLYKQLISFSGWTLFGSLANVGLQQGTNVIVNIFYGVTVNAAIGIANQINAAITQLVSGFQQALNPQLVRSEAQHDSKRQFDLICLSSKFSYLILFIIIIPVIVHLDYILQIWLGNYPEHTNSICILIIIGGLFECVSGPLYTTIYATGKIRIYQIVISSIILLNIPLAYFIGKYSFSVENVFVIRNIIYILCLVTRLLFLIQLINFNLVQYIKKVILPLIVASILIILPVIFFNKNISNDIFSLIYNSIIIFLYELIICYIFALGKNEKKYISNFIKIKIAK